MLDLYNQGVAQLGSIPFHPVIYARYAHRRIKILDAILSGTVYLTIICTSGSGGHSRIPGVRWSSPFQLFYLNAERIQSAL
jgi:hypothetical protein